jgi:hypothetical protein
MSALDHFCIDFDAQQRFHDDAIVYHFEAGHTDSGFSNLF